MWEIRSTHPTSVLPLWKAFHCWAVRNHYKPEEQIPSYECLQAQRWCMSCDRPSASPDAQKHSSSLEGGCLLLKHIFTRGSEGDKALSLPLLWGLRKPRRSNMGITTAPLGRNGGYGTLQQELLAWLAWWMASCCAGWPCGLGTVLPCHSAVSL